MKVLELGGGDNRQEGVACMVDVRPGPQVDFTADFDKPLPMQDSEWDVVLAIYVIEHLSWRSLPLFLAEVHRITKPGGKIQLVTANTEAQLVWVQKQKIEDARKTFEQCSCILFGDQDYPENTHKLYLSPLLFHGLLEAAGFTGIRITVVGATKTDMMAEAVKPEQPAAAPPITTRDIQELQEAATKEGGGYTIIQPGHMPMDIVKRVPFSEPTITLENLPDAQVQVIHQEPPERLYDFAYFNGGGKVGGYAREGYWDYPVHEISARKILAHKPSSVLELGCARGYVLKRLQDAGVIGVGLEVSKHCYMTRVADGINQQDLLKTPWLLKDQSIDLLYSIATLEHIPEEFLPDVIREMSRVSARCVHGVDFGQKDDGFDKTHCTLKPRAWWLDLFNEFYRGDLAFPKSFEILDKEEFEAGPLPEDYIKGDGKIKLNIGCATTMFHNGWLNADILDQKGFAQFYGYKFTQHDVRNGLPCNTGSVDLIFCVKPGAMVRTWLGMRPIERVKVGDLVLTHKGRWKKVTRTFKREVSNEKMTELHGPIVPFSLTSNHEMFVKRSMDGYRGPLVFASSFQWVPSDLVETNDRVLVPLPPLEEQISTYDLSALVDQSGSEVVHQALAARKSGQTYDEIVESVGITKQQARDYTNGRGLPRGVVFIKDGIMHLGNSGVVIPAKVQVNEDFGRIVGYMISDGWADGAQMGMAFGGNQGKYGKDAIHLIEKVFGVRPSRACLDRGNTIWNISYYSVLLSRVFKKMLGSVKGKKARKRLPRLLLRCGNQAFYRGFITGIWRGDGTTTGSTGCLVTVDSRLAYQTQEILGRLGVASSIHKYKTCYNVCVHGNSYRLLAKIMGTDWTPPKKSNPQFNFVAENAIESRIRIRQYRYTGPVYNLEVEEDHSYTVNGIAVHNCCHFLEHLSYDEGVKFLRECRRAIKPDGALRIIVPDTRMLTNFYLANSLDDFDHVNEGCKKAKAYSGKLWSLLHEGHSMAYDQTSLSMALMDSGWMYAHRNFREGHKQILAETLDMLPCLSLYADAYPSK